VKDYYGILKLPRDATIEEIREAYFDAARVLHPDANPSEESNELFLLVQEAFDILSNDEKRAAFDRTLLSKYEKPAIRFKCITSRSNIPLLDEPQLLYVLLGLDCTATEVVATGIDVHLTLVVDRSTSMVGSRLDMVKANILQTIKKMRPTDTISIVGFSDRAEVILPPTKVKSLELVERTVASIDTSGATEIFKGLELGCYLLRNYANERMVRQLILITDGHTYGDEQACFELAQAANKEGIAISALGVGAEWNDEFLDKLTSFSGGSTVLINTPKDLLIFFDAKISSIIHLYARQITVEFEPVEGVQSRYLFRLLPDLGSLPISPQIPLGSLQAGRTLSFVMELLVKPLLVDQEEVQLLKGKFKLDIPSLGDPFARIPFEISRKVVSQLEKETPPPAIVDAMSRLTLYRMQELAKNEVGEGKFKEATKHLQYLATHLLLNGDKELAHTVLEEADNIQKNHQVSEMGFKNIKFGTRALLLPSGPEQTIS
jgi:Ca-activated chloride channel family protein